MKTVTVNLPGTRDWEEVEVAPGATPMDILAQLDLGSDFRLAMWGDPTSFGDTENVYQAIQDGEKLQAVSVAEVAHE